jgi:hypothetical protein
VSLLLLLLFWPLLFITSAEGWQQLSSMSTYVYTVITFATFCAIVFTAIVAIRQLKSSSYSQIYSRLDTINYLLVERMPQLKFGQSTFNPEDFSFAAPERHLVGMLFTLFENVYYQRHKFRVLGDADWNAWKLTIRETLAVPYVREYWKGNGSGTGRSSYTLEFQEVIQEILNERISC